MKQSHIGPEFLKWFGPVLDALRDLGGSAKPADVTELIARKYDVPKEVLEAKTKTGVPRFYNQVAWARQYLVNGGYLDSSRRGVWTLTEKGKKGSLSAQEAFAVFSNVRESFVSPLAIPIVRALRKLGGSGKPHEVSDLIAKDLNIPSSILDATVKDGSSRFHNQVAWARNYLVKAGFLDSSYRGTWVLTEKGRAEDLPKRNFRQEILEEFKVYQKKKGDPKDGQSDSVHSVEPEIIVREAEQEEQLQLLDILRKLTPKGFEEICGLLLRESGFENVIVSGRSRDGGFDGSGRLAINPLVSLTATFQCKKYVGSVSRAEVGDFRNSMLGRAEKGIFITTGTFSTEARKEAERVDPKIELVDGEKLVTMFESNTLGVKPRTVYDVDMPFFEPYMK